MRRRQDASSSLSQRPISAAVPASTTWEIRSATSASAMAKREPAACVLLSASSSDVVSSTAARRGSSRTSTAAVTTGRRTTRRPEGTRRGRARTASSRRSSRRSLLEDVWALVRLNEQNIAEFLSLSSQLVNDRVESRDRHRAVASTTSPIASSMSRSGRRSSDGCARRSSAVDRLGWAPRTERIGRRPEPSIDVIFTTGLCGARSGGAARSAARSPALHVTGAAQLDPSLVDTTLQLAAINGDAALYERYFERMTGRASPGEQAQYLSRAGVLRRSRTAEAHARVRDVVGGPIAGRPDLIRLVDGAAVGERGDVGARQEQLGQPSRRSFGMFQGIPTVVGSMQHLCDAASRNDVERFFSHASDRAARTARCNRRWKPSTAASRRNGASREPGGDFSVRLQVALAHESCPETPTRARRRSSARGALSPR